jgi:FixJ family two-component response regulator
MADLQTVFIVDDDAAMRESMGMLLETAGLTVETFPSAHAFLERYSANDGGCLVLDQRMPEMTGLELQEEMLQRGYALPIIFLSGYGDVPTTVRAVKGGAVDFLEKPVEKDTLITRITDALAADRAQREAAAEQRMARYMYSKLTNREREVMALATRGLANKEIARELSISPRTVENHRARVMEKMRVENIAKLCHIAALCLPTDEESANSE